MSLMLRRFLRVSGYASCSVKLAAASRTLEDNSCRWTTSLQPRKQSWRWMSMSGGDGRGKSIGDDDSSLAMRDSYMETSGNQYSAHLGCQDMLLGCAKRLKEQQQRGHQNNPSATTQWKIADLGSADGSNSIRTIEIFLDELNRDGEPNNMKESTTGDSNLHIVFEEHPSSDEAKLTETVASWFENKTRESVNKSERKISISCDVLMKSFYEPLFEPNSVDFCMSYICLHWLDSTDTRGSEGIRGWKRLHLDDSSGENETGLDGFLQVSERTAPQELKALWKEELADRHLARFLALRAQELKPGAELLVVMVSHLHEYLRPERSHESPLLKAMKKCIAEGSLRQQVLERTIVPYYLRQPQDVLDALALAQQQEAQNQEAPIHSLEIIDIRQYETLTGGGNENENGDGMKGARDLFWAIHGGAVVNTGGANDDEVLAIKNRLVETFDESYDLTTGIVKGNFIACVFRKKNDHAE